MTWIAGVDEAGYGPNLGPFVMTLVACRVADDPPSVDLWDVLQSAVRRHTDPRDRRLLVADSKLVYAPARGLHDLEANVLALLFPEYLRAAAPLASYLDHLCPAAHPALRDEPWYAADGTLPASVDPTTCVEASARFRAASQEQRIDFALVRSVVLCPPRFNELLARWGSKGGVLAHALSELIACLRSLEGDDPIWLAVDKHGGRNTYTAMLQDALGDGMVVPQEEGRLRSVYRVLGLPRAMTFTFQPRADVEHFCVALASMVSKYVRELLMRDFNAFWLRHVPGLNPTAGYPGDAERYLAAILPAANRLGIGEAVLWRRK